MPHAFNSNATKEILVKELPRWKFADTAEDELKWYYMDKSVHEFLKMQFSGGTGQSMDLRKNGIMKIRGWCVDFRDFLNLYWYKQYGRIYEAYAPDKTRLRNGSYGRIDKILVVED